VTQLAAGAADASADPRVEPEAAPTVPNRRSRRSVAFLTAVALTPIVVLVVRLVGFNPRFAPDSDIAVTELSVRDVGHHPVLVGAYSRFGWHHLGPWFFYLLAVPYRVFGSTSAAMYAGAALFNIAMIAGVVAVAYRRGGARLAVWVVAMLSLYLAAISPAIYASPWNPLMVLFAFVGFVLVAWSVAVGDVVLLPVAVALGSFCVQTHIGYAGVVGLGGLTALAGALVHRVPGRRWKAPLILSAIVLAVLWLPPVVQQLRPGGGNMSDVASWFVHSHPENSVTGSAPVVVRELGLMPARALDAVQPYNGRAEKGGADAPWLLGVLTLAVTAAAAFVAWRRRARDALWLFGICGVLVAGSVVVLARVDGPLFGFITIWTSTPGLLCWFAVGTVALPERAASPRARAAYVAVVALVGVMAVGNTVAAVTTDSPTATFDAPSLHAFTDAVLPRVPATPGAQVYAVSANRRTWPIMMGLVNQLERHGVRVKVNGWAFMIGPRRTADTQPPGSIALVFSDGKTAEELRADPGNEELADNGDVWMFLAHQGR
jgi:hypothetical protein